MPIGWKTQRFHEVDSGRRRAAPHDEGGATITHSKFAIPSARQLEKRRQPRKLPKSRGRAVSE
ncbi:hypothetical protein RB6677 [Rhodopirellula baltica SH 1]|uniref:Uncharacterized protein n=1 Tax=Rhodopirellula baltica (strain DSM 10527 / NCIMB 13988 / SH1) TaxID=243090 RepID=Q7UPW9_RHOBA|nr:hypothetical protein RB6677 [Rhodopirellula baltica SH 1]